MRVIVSRPKPTQAELKLIIPTLLTIAVAMLIVGCGEADSVDSVCNYEEPSGQIYLRNSGISCDEARATIDVLGSERGEQVVGSPGDIWTCVWGDDHGVEKFACKQGLKRFELLIAH